MTASPDTGTDRRRLPDGFVARIRPDLLRNTGGLLVGGSPLRALRLSARARSYLDDDRVVVRDATSAKIAARLIDGNLADPEPHGTEVDPADLAVVVPVRDRHEALDRCLAALRGLDVVVVDDASRDRARVASVVARHGATLIPLDHNIGPAGARNIGLAQVRTPYVAFVDSDVEVERSTLLGLARHLADEQVGLVGPLVAGVPRSTHPRWFERYDAVASSLDLGGTGASVRPGSAVAWLPGACLVGRVAHLGRGFDDRMRVGEDVDLVWRLVRSGVAVRYDPTWVARHETRATLRGWLGRKFVYGTGGAALARRHGGWTAPAVLSPATAVGAAALLLRRWWSLPVAAASLTISIPALHRALPAAERRSIPLSVDVATRGLGWAVRQESALLLRHWWPATLAAATFSRRTRRVVASALVIDAVVAAHDRPGVDLMSAFAGRRLDDLFYGAGLWAGAVRARSLRCLTPRRAATHRYWCPRQESNVRPFA